MDRALYKTILAFRNLGGPAKPRVPTQVNCAGNSGLSGVWATREARNLRQQLIKNGGALRGPPSLMICVTIPGLAGQPGPIKA